MSAPRVQLLNQRVAVRNTPPTRLLETLAVLGAACLTMILVRPDALSANGNVKRTIRLPHTDSCVVSSYPSDWRLRGFSGVVDVDAWVNERGTVDSARLVTLGFPDTDTAAVRYALRCTFDPERDALGAPIAERVRIHVPFEHPRSQNLLRTSDRFASGRGASVDTVGRVRKLMVKLRCSVVVDSVIGSYVYSYWLRNEGGSEAKLAYFALLPFDPAQRRSVPAGQGFWPGNCGCGDRPDVMVWNTFAGYEKRGRLALGLPPGEELGPFQLESLDPPVRGRWLSGGSDECGAACYPWGANCKLDSSVKGNTFVPGSGGRNRGTLTGQVHFAEEGPSPRARVEALCAWREAYTDLAGRFRLDEVPTGSFRVQITAAGYEPWDSLMTITPDEQQVVVRLARSSAVRR